MYPENYRYSKEHEWIRLEGEEGIVGITDFAQEQLGDVVYVELPEPGARFKAGEVFGTIESVKAVSELYCPVDGEVVRVNQKVVEAPELVNKDPHGEAWLIALRVDDPSQLDRLLRAEQYREYVEKEAEKS